MDQEKIRLDQYLNGKLSDISRSKIQSSIRSGEITLNGESVKPGIMLKGGEEITGEKNTFFELEKDLVQKLISALNLSLSKSEERRVKKVQTESFDSFNAYSTALDSYDKGEYEESLTLLEKATEFDEDFDLAWDRLEDLEEKINTQLSKECLFL